jgi:hypothetical protein
MIAEDVVILQQLRSDQQLAEVFLHTPPQSSLVQAVVAGSRPW